MTFKYLCVAISLFFATSALAQDPAEVSRFFYELSKKDPFEKSSLPDVIDKDEIYLNPEFQKGTINYAGKELNLLYRINILDDQIEVKQSPDSDINYLEMLSGIQLEDGNSIFTFLPVDGMKVVSLLHESDNVRLVKSFQANLIIPTRDKNGYTSNNEPRFNRLKDKYVLIYDANIIEVEKWKRMTDDFDNPEIIKYLKKKKPKFKTESEMLEFAKFLDTI